MGRWIARDAQPVQSPYWQYDRRDVRLKRRRYLTEIDGNVSSVPMIKERIELTTLHSHEDILEMLAY